MESQDSIEIKVAMIRLNLTQAQIARDLKMQRQSVNQVINGHRKSKRISDYLATRLMSAA